MLQWRDRFIWIEWDDFMTTSIIGSVNFKVMVIDDSSTIRRSAEIFLSQAGYPVVLAEDGFDALAKVNDHKPALIFCDILMPSARWLSNLLFDQEKR